MLVSIIINNYNYDRYLAEAIDSALGQTYANIEVIVVDDGSTDNSRNVIAGYGDRIKPILKPNGGQASAFNAGFNRSSGQVILFLDSDDILNPTAVLSVMPFFTKGKIAKVHWPLNVIDESGRKTGQIVPQNPLPEGDFRDYALISGPPFCFSPPTSGNAWSRGFIESVVPIPELDFMIAADTYLFETAALFGPVKRLKRPQGSYRIHSRNNYSIKSFKEKLRLEIRLYNSLFDKLDDYCRRMGVFPDLELWKNKSWFHLLDKAVHDLIQQTPKNSKIILVDDGSWGLVDSFEGRWIWPFPDENGDYIGCPNDDAHAITGLNCATANGADYIVFAWASFWWLTHYSGLNKFLRSNFKSVLENERIIVFDLRESQ